MKEKNKNKTGRSEYLRYISGEMAGRERNIFERNLQKDEFAEEASEGFSELSADQVTDDLSHLDKRLKSRVSRRNTVIFYRIAASVAVLLVLSSVFIVLNHKSPSEKLSEIPDQPVTLDISESKAVQEPAAPIEHTEKMTRAKNIAAGRSEITVPEKVADEVLPIKEDVAVRSDKSDKVEKNIIAVAEQRPTGMIATGQKAAMTAAAAGEVAGIASKKATDALELDQKMISDDSMVSALDEVVVVGYGAGQNTENEITGYSPPVPTIGKSSFKKYITDNIRKPATLDKGERAVVVIRIIVRSSGIIDSLKVIRSPGKEFSEEAIRLIKEGPSWKPAEKNGVKIDDETRIGIIFK